MHQYFYNTPQVEILSYSFGQIQKVVKSQGKGIVHLKDNSLHSFSVLTVQTTRASQSEHLPPTQPPLFSVLCTAP